MGDWLSQALQDASSDARVRDDREGGVPIRLAFGLIAVGEVGATTGGVTIAELPVDDGGCGDREILAHLVGAHDLEACGGTVMAPLP